MPAVMDQIRREMGPDAVILHSKQSRPWGPLQLLGKSGVEILAAVDRAAMPRPAEPATADIAAPAPPSPGDLRGEVATLRRLFAQVGGARLLPPGTAPLYERLVAGGVEAGLALRLLAELGEDGADDAASELPESRLADLLATRIRTDAEAMNATSSIAVVGPTGAGKTTTLAKLLTRARLGGGTTEVLSLDGSGFGGPGLLQTVAALLDVPYAIALTPADLADHRPMPVDGLTLIDTPGLGPADETGIAALGALLRSARPRQIHLVLPATSKAEDAAAAVRAFARVGVTHLLFTRLDEAVSCGSVLAVSLEAGLPLSCFGTGRDVPDDLVAADLATLVHRTLQHGDCPA